jgi:prolipoprotein diacylglyceryltransferase
MGVARDAAASDVMATFTALIVVVLVTWGLTLAPPFDPGAELHPLTLAGHDVSRVAAYYWAWAIGLACGGFGALMVLRRRDALSWATFVPLMFALVAFIVGARWGQRLETMPIAEALALRPRDLFGPGMRLPLGLFLGGVVACASAKAFGGSWLAVGDAYAVSSSVAIPIGRIGCLLYGCCMGAICERWPSALCLTWHPGTEPHRHQLTVGAIQLGTEHSLPVHPLPIYFALASLVTLAVLVLLLRRNARPGALLAAFCIMRPLAKLGLEPLRAADPGGILMVAIPGGVLFATCLTLMILYVRSTRVQSGAPISERLA